MTWLQWLCGVDGKAPPLEPPGEIPPAPERKIPCTRCSKTGMIVCPACIGQVGETYECGCAGGKYVVCPSCSGSGLVAPKKRNPIPHVPHQLITSLGIDADYVRSVTLRFEANKAATIEVEYLCYHDHMRAVSGDLRAVVRDIIREKRNGATVQERLDAAMAASKENNP